MAVTSSTVRADQVRTAVRFPLHLEIVVLSGGREYHAVTQDVSANGVLFAAEEVPAIGAHVEFRLKMPAAVMGGAEDVLLHCNGRIVRHMKTANKTLAAAVIDEYTLKAEHV